MNLASSLWILGPSFVLQGEIYFRNQLFDPILCNLEQEEAGHKGAHKGVEDPLFIF